MSEAIAFDTHRFVKHLTETGFTEAQAEALAQEQVMLLNTNLATKADLARVEAALKADLARVEAALKAGLRPGRMFGIVLGVVALQTNSRVAPVSSSGAAKCRGPSRRWRVSPPPPP